jgi:hypothetical protein
MSRVSRGMSALVLVLALSTYALRVSPASAMPGPGYLATGFVDDVAFESVDPAVRATWLTNAQNLSSSWVRLTAAWFTIAPPHPPSTFRPKDPSDPNYHWPWLDEAVRDAAAHHQHVLMLIYQAPAFALGHAPNPAFAAVWRPKAAAIGAFAHALAVRYSGRFPDPARPGRTLPRVSYFQAWNEPNLRPSIMPQWTRSKGRWVATSPSIYRAMLNAVYTNVKAVQRHAHVIAAGLAPDGDPPGVNRMSPVLFLRELLCLRGSRLRPERCPHPAHLDGIDTHPYSINPTYSSPNPLDTQVPDVGRLRRVLMAAVRKHRAFPRAPKSIWETELDWWSNPPEPGGVSVAQQAAYLEQAFYQLWRQGVGHVFWFLIRDFPYQFNSGGGVFFGDGSPKPAATAFQFPFVVTPDKKHRVFTIWGRSPIPGKVSVQVQTSGGWHRLLNVRTTRGAVFYAKRHLGRQLVLRAQIGRYTSLSWSTG